MVPLVLTLSLFGTGLLMAFIGMPLALGRVRRNSLYGFRTRKTLSSDHVWYLANRHSGRALVAAGLFVMFASLPFFFIAPLLGAKLASYLVLAVLIAAVLGLVVSSLKYLARL